MGADFSYPQHLGNPSHEAEEELDRYLLNDSKDDFFFMLLRMALLKLMESISGGMLYIMT